jgi:Mg-chelatase subunit ChlI
MDDINLLPPALVALIAETCDRGTNLMEREGLSARGPARFVPLASMNPEEGALSPRFLDRFGMCVALNTLGEGASRMDIMRTAGHDAGTADDRAGLDELRRLIAGARMRVHAVAVSGEI